MLIYVQIWLLIFVQFHHVLMMENMGHLLVPHTYGNYSQKW